MGGGFLQSATIQCVLSVGVLFRSRRGRAIGLCCALTTASFLLDDLPVFASELELGDVESAVDLLEWGF